MSDFPAYEMPQMLNKIENYWYLRNSIILSVG